MSESTSNLQRHRIIRPVSLLFAALLLLLASRSGPAAAVDIPRAGAFPHELLTSILSRFVSKTGKLDYKGITANRAALDDYVRALALVSPARNRELFPTHGDQLAYYINGYNALAITGVIDRPGLQTVNEPRWGFFVGTRYVVGGQQMDLNTLENVVIRPTFKDPRLHFALNCQSAGCPRLPQAAFDPAKMEAQLDAAAQEFCTDPSRVYADAAGVWHISQIFDWYKADFQPGGVTEFINGYGGKIPAGARVEIIPYDWRLSAQPGKGP